MLTPQQSAERNSYLGGSDCAAALGLSRFKTTLQLWAEKTGKIEPEDISKKVNVRLGNKLEDAVAQFFMEETGKKVQRVNSTRFHEKYPFLGANIDRKVVGEDAILECKTASAWMAKEWAGEEIPQEYILQVMHYLAVTGASKGYIAVLIGNADFKWKEIVRDEQIIEQIITKEVAFWNTFVVPQVMPMTISYDDGSTLYDLFPVSDPNKDIILPDSLNTLIETRNAMTQDMISLQESIKRLENEIKATLGDAERGRTSSFQVSWKTQHRKSFTVAESSSRVLRIKRLNEE